MDYSNIFSYMQAEVTLIAVIVLLFLYDLIAGERGRRWFSAVACGLLAVQVLANVVPGTAGEVFGGMFCYVPMHTVVKSVLAIGALIVCLQAGTWLRRDDTAHKQGEFYILRVVGKILYGTCTNEAHLRLSDATWDERLSVVCLVVAIAGMGLAPLWVSDMIRGSVSEIITHLMN